MPKQYSHMVVSRLQDVGVDLDDATLEHPEHAPVSELIAAGIAAGAASLGLLFSQSPVIEATLLLASSTT